MVEPPSVRNTISILETAESVHVSVIYPCTNPACKEAFHTANFDNFAEASKLMSAYAQRYLAKAEIKGSA